MQSASDDVAEDRIVWTCCKNNDGELGDRSAWIRCNGLFDPVSDFDWDAWNSDGLAVKAEKLKLIKFQKGKDAYVV